MRGISLYTLPTIDTCVGSERSGIITTTTITTITTTTPINPRSRSHRHAWRQQEIYKCILTVIYSSFVINQSIKSITKSKNSAEEAFFCFVISHSQPLFHVTDNNVVEAWLAHERVDPAGRPSNLAFVDQFLSSFHVVPPPENKRMGIGMWLISASCKTALVSARGVVLVKYCGREKKNVPRRGRGGEVVVFTMYFLGLTFF